MTTRPAKAWALEWRSVSRLDGDSRHLIHDKDTNLPLLFKTRAQARQHAEASYGYIRARPDLQQEPHGWRMPRAVTVAITIEAGQ